MQETWVRSLVWEDLEKGTAIHSNILAWRIPWIVYSVGLQRARHDWVTFTFTVDNSHVVTLVDYNSTTFLSTPFFKFTKERFLVHCCIHLNCETCWKKANRLVNQKPLNEWQTAGRFRVKWNSTCKVSWKMSVESRAE